MRKSCLVGLLVSLVVMSWIPLAFGLTYDVQQLTQSLKDAPWVFKATTDDPTVTTVVFTWYYPGVNGQVFSKQAIAGQFTFVASIIPDQFGEWYLTIDFLAGDGTPKNAYNHLETITEQGYIPPPVVPEIPLLGTVGAVVAMLLGFTFYAKRKTGSASLKHVPHL